jgi:AcrR family transcriptional regulator
MTTSAASLRSVGEGGEAAPRKRVRKDPASRRAELVRAAREVFGRSGYADTGITEIAHEAQVSKALLYHYFPDGRPQLFVAVAEQLLEEFRARVRQAAQVPFSPEKRMEQLLGAIFGFFDNSPEAYRLLFRDSSASRDHAVEEASAVTRAQLSAELAALMASSGMDADELVAVSSGILGFVLANVDLVLAEQIDAETAWRVSTAYATAAVSI